MCNIKKWIVQLSIFIILCGVNFTFIAFTSINFGHYAKSLYRLAYRTNNDTLHRWAYRTNNDTLHRWAYRTKSIHTNDKKESGTSNCCSDSYWDTLVESDVITGSQIMDYFMWTNSSSCRLAHDFGGKILRNPSGKDGQKSVCIDPQVAPQSRNCLVYSFGINNEWSFDEEMEEYGCEVFAFDPSMKTEPHDHTAGIHFYNWGLSDRDEIIEADINGTQWQMYSLFSVYKNLSGRHGYKVIDYLKMDTEGSEWNILPNMIMTGMLSNVRQIGVEIHLPSYSKKDFRKLIKLLRVFEKKGFVRFNSKYNPWYISNFTHLHLRQTAGYEIAWYNSKLLRPTS